MRIRLSTPAGDPKFTGTSPEQHGVFDSPTVLTIKVLFAKPGLPIGEQGSRGRAEMLGTSFARYERALREQLADMFAPGGFDPRRDIAGIILNRWGHAYVNPQPGFFFGTNGEPAPRDQR